MVVGLLPTSAFAIWGIDNYYECIFCGAVYYGEDVDDSIYEESDYCCGIDGNSDCWLENHCYECGEYVARSVKNDCCNWCDDCIEDQGTHCSECDECYLSEEDQLCGECHRCDTCAGGICDECGLCMDCCMENRNAAGCELFCIESSEFEEHFCEGCGECFCNEEQCVYCGLCETCCAAALEEAKVDGCDECNEYGCVEDDTFADHMQQERDPDYKLPEHTCRLEKSWSMNENYHWKACVYKSCDEPYTNAAHQYHSHEYVDDICKDCGYMRNNMVYFTTQPKNVYLQVSDTMDWTEASDGTKTYGSTFPWNYRTTFRVKAFGKNLTYQWYQVYNGGTHRALVDRKSWDGQSATLYVNGATTPTLTISVHPGSCSADIYYYCVATDAKGNEATSKNAYVRGSHRYNLAVQYPDPNDDSEGSTSSEVSFWISKESVGLGHGWYSVGVNSGGEGHRWYCCGSGCTATRNKVSEPHDFQPTGEKIKGTYSYEKAVAGKWLDFDLNQCSICGAKKYIEIHEHEYRAAKADEADKDLWTATAHPTICKNDSCGKLSSERHTWVFESYKWPGQDDTDGIVKRVCVYCGYVDSEDFTWKAVGTDGSKSELRWNDTNILVDVENGTANRTLVNPGETVVLTPELDGEHKFSGWKARYYYWDTDKNEEGWKDIATSTDSTWSYTIPADFFTANGVPGGGMLKFTGLYDEGTCTHENCTTEVGKKPQVCIYDGYTGDEVCDDCGAVTDKGSVIKASADAKHEGTLTLVPGTAVAASCSKRGYEGDFECSVCKHTVSGERTGYAHNNQTIVNAKAATCFDKGYTGDTVCADCGKSLANGKETPKLDHIWDEGEPGVAHRGPITFMAMIYHCTREGCNGSKTELLRDAPEMDKDGKITKLDFAMTGYTLGNTVGNVDVTMPAVVSDSTYRMYKSIPLKKTDDGMVFVPPTITGSGHILNDGKQQLAKTHSFLAEKNYYLVVTVNPNEGMSLHSKAVAALNETQSALYFGEVTIPPTKVGETTIPASTAIMAVFKLEPLPASSQNVTVKYSEAADSGAGKYETGSTVTIKAGTKEGYTFSGWTSADGVTFTDATNVSTTFTMPANDVTVVANWTKNGSTPTDPVDPVEPIVPVIPPATPVKPTEPGTPTFPDVLPGGWYEDAVNWAVDKGITTGTPDGLFDPDGLCTRAQAVTFLWRAAGSPAPKSAAMPFTDVKAGSFCYDAVLWAVENGITKGTGETTFSPDLACDRAQIVTLLYRFAQLLGKDVSVGGDTNILSYADAASIPDYAFEAMQWACGTGVMQGDGVNLMPTKTCTRAQIVTFIYRCMK